MQNKSTLAALDWFRWIDRKFKIFPLHSKRSLYPFTLSNIKCLRVFYVRFIMESKTIKLIFFPLFLGNHWWYWIWRKELNKNIFKVHSRDMGNQSNFDKLLFSYYNFCILFSPFLVVVPHILLLENSRNNCMNNKVFADFQEKSLSYT